MDGQLVLSIGVVERNHDDVIKWKHFPRYWPFVRGISRTAVDSLHKDQWRGALMFSLICTAAPKQTVEQTIETPVIWDYDYGVNIMKEWTIKVESD